MILAASVSGVALYLMFNSRIIDTGRTIYYRTNGVRSIRNAFKASNGNSLNYSIGKAIVCIPQLSLHDAHESCRQVEWYLSTLSIYAAGKYKESDVDEALKKIGIEKKVYGDVAYKEAVNKYCYSYLVSLTNSLSNVMYNILKPYSGNLLQRFLFKKRFVKWCADNAGALIDISNSFCSISIW